MRLISRKAKQYLSQFLDEDWENAVMFFCGFVCGAALSYDRFPLRINDQTLNEAKAAFGDNKVFESAKANLGTVMKLVAEGKEYSVPALDRWMDGIIDKSHAISHQAFNFMMYGCRYGAFPMVKVYNPGISDGDAVRIVQESLELDHYYLVYRIAYEDYHELKSKRENNHALAKS